MGLRGRKVVALTLYVPVNKYMPKNTPKKPKKKSSSVRLLSLAKTKKLKRPLANRFVLGCNMSC